MFTTRLNSLIYVNFSLLKYSSIFKMFYSNFFDIYQIFKYFLKIYHEAFEVRFLEATEELYRAEGQRLIQEQEVSCSVARKYF